VAVWKRVVPQPKAPVHVVETVNCPNGKSVINTGEKKVILFNLSGHGNLDLGAYDDYFEGKLSDFEYPDSKIQDSLSRLPTVG
jgi:tryptophan synthase beta chain